MRILISFLFLCGSSGIWAQSSTLLQEMTKLQQRYHVHFLYDARTDVEQPYDGPSLAHYTLEESLRLLFDARKIAWKQRGRNISLHGKPQAIGVPTRYVVRGSVCDGHGDALPCASVYDATSGQGTLTDGRGRYVLLLNKGTHRLRASYLGGGCHEDTLQVNVNLVHHFTLRDEVVLNEIIVRGEMSNPLHTTQTGKTILTSDEICQEFSLLSSPDVVKGLQQLPGVSSGVELSSSLLVHGGNADENMFLFDGAPIYQTNHSLGLFSAFNADAVKTIEFYKSGFPARYSGKVSSVTEVHTKDGNLQQHHGSFSIGLLDGRLHLSGPIIKGKTTYSVALRRSWIDLPLRLGCSVANRGNDDKYSIGYVFHDFNGRVTHRPNDKHLLWASVYSGADRYLIDDESGAGNYVSEMRNKFQWGNFTISFGDDWQLSERLSFSLLSTYAKGYSVHDYEDNETYPDDGQSENRMTTDRRKQHTAIHDMSVSVKARWLPMTCHHVQFGVKAVLHFFNPQSSYQSFTTQSTADDTVYVNQHHRNTSSELTLFVEDEMTVSRRWSANIGVSGTKWWSSSQSYTMFDPRFAVRYQFSSRASVKASFTRMSQSMHRIASSCLELPTDFWVPTDERHLPVRSNQWACGIYYQPTSKWNMSAEGFYKHSYHLLQWRNWMGIQPSPVEWSSMMCDGQGRSWGIETNGSYRGSNLSVTLSYTLSWSRRNFPEFYQGWFYDQFDNRHKLNATIRYRLNPRISCYAGWHYHSGNRMSFPVASILQPAMPGERWDNMSSVDVYSKPNNLSLPAYHRLDLGTDFHSTTRRGHERVWNVSVYNAYCHLNTMYVKLVRRGDYTFQVRCRGYVPIIPSVSYTYKF